MHTGRKILNLRCDRKISQQDLARACDITPSALSKIEAGINSPRANILWRIAQNLGVTVEYLLDEQIPYPYQPHSYRQKFLEDKVDPASMFRKEVSREEGAFLDELRKSHRVAREIAFSLPEFPVETLRMVHFMVTHWKVQNPDPVLWECLRNLATTGRPSAPEETTGPSKPKRSSKKKATASAAKTRGERRTPRRR